MWRYIYIPFGWLFPKKTLIKSLLKLRKDILKELDPFAIKPLTEIQRKHFTTKNKKHINYILLDYVCRKYSIPIFRYKNNTKGTINNNIDIALWIEELGYEFSEKEDERRQNMFEVKEKAEGELIKQSNDFLNQYCMRVPEFSLKHISYALGFIILLVALIKYLMPFLRKLF